MAEEIAEAEREFNRVVRSVASAYGTLRDLEGPLKRLEYARSGVAHESVQPPDIEDLLIGVHSDDTSVARIAIKAILERVVVGDNSVEVIPRI
jgi:hypothetical protein